MNARDKVVRQALTEYVTARAPDVFDLDNPTTAELYLCLSDYISRRYGNHRLNFQVDAHDRLVNSLRAALEELRAISNRE